MSPHFRSDHDAVTMGSLIVVLTALAVYCSEIYCDTVPTKIAKLEETVFLEKNNSHVMLEKGNFWKNLNLSRRKPMKLEESRNLNSTNSEVDKRKGRFLNSLAFLTGLSFGGLAAAASSTKSIAKMPQAFSINLGSSKTSPYFAAYYSQYPLFYPGPLGLASVIDAVKSQTQNDLTPQVINLFDNKPISFAGNNEDYIDAEKSNVGNGADDRKRFEADRNAEEKDTIGVCKESQMKHNKEMAREREYLQVNAGDLRATLNFRQANQTIHNATTTSSPDNTTHHHHHHHHHHHGGKEYFPEYYGGYPQNIHHVDLTTTQPYSQISYNVPYEPTNFYHDDKYTYPGLNPSYSASFSPDQTNEYASAAFNRLYPSGYQPPNISDGFKPLQ